jgi:hypothetical protein
MALGSDPRPSPFYSCLTEGAGRGFTMGNLCRVCAKAHEAGFPGCWTAFLLSRAVPFGS